MATSQVYLKTFHQIQCTNYQKIGQILQKHLGTSCAFGVTCTDTLTYITVETPAVVDSDRVTSPSNPLSVDSPISALI